MRISKTVAQAAATAILITLVAATGTTRAEEPDLEQSVKAGDVGGIVGVPVGESTTPLVIDRPLVLAGENPEGCVLNVTADKPALSVTTREPVVIEGLTIKWQLATSDGRSGPAAALLTKDANLTLRNCHFIALGSGKRCPSAIACTGFSKLTIEHCRFDGFEFAITVGGGADATVSDCVLQNPGHCGLTVFSDSRLEVARTVVTGSAYHGLRCTGGTLIAHDNLIINNKNRGIYLGNRDARGRISNNVILGNATGISGFGQSEVVIENNLLLNSTYAGLDARGTCRLTVRNNVFQDNVRGMVQFKESGRSQLTVGRNTFWNNETDTKDLTLPPKSLFIDPQLVSAATGKFAVKSAEVQEANQGLSDVDALSPVWARWRALSDGK